jgi:hypothetical protein
MSNFTTRPNLDNRDFTQTSGSTLNLYGITNVNDIDGVLNVDGKLTSKGVEIDASTGSSVIGYGLIFNGEKIVLQSIPAGDITGATNGLTKVGKNIILGGRLSGTTTIIFEQSGTTYGNIGYTLKLGEEENAFSVRTTSTLPTNPITEIKSNAGGVELTHSDDITVSNININDSGNEILSLDVTGGSYSKINTGIDPQINLPYVKLETVRGDNSATNQIKVIKTGITLTLQNFSGTDLVRLEFGNDSATKYIDNRNVKTGIQYGGNYRSDFTEFTLVDKGFVEQLVSNTSGSTVVIPSAITRTELFTYNITANTYYLSVNPIDILFLDVNGLVQRKGVDYTTSGNNVNILTTYDNGDIIQVVYYEQNIVGVSVETFWSDILGTIELQTDLVNYVNQEILDSIGQTIVSGVTGLSASQNAIYQQLQLKADNNNLLKYSLSSGIISGGGITISSDPTKIDIGFIIGYIVDNWTDVNNPVVHYIQYAGQTGVSVTYLGTASTSHIAIDKNGIIQQYSQAETNTERRDALMLATLGHTDNTIVRSINYSVATIESPIEQLRDLLDELKLINDGNTISANGVNLNINKSYGTLFGDGINRVINRKDPHKIVISASTAASFRYRTQIGGTGGTVTLIDPTRYDNGGILTSIGGSPNQATNQRIYLFPNGNIVIQYGQTIYSTLSAAITGIQSETFNEYINIQQNAILISILSVTKGCTNLSDTSTARFIPVSKFGESIGGAAGISTGTLQSAYNNSLQPEIITNSTLGAVTLKRGSTSDDDNVFEIINGSGTTTYSINGHGIPSNLSQTVTSGVTGKTPSEDAVYNAILASTPPSPLPTISGYTSISGVTVISLTNANINKCNVIGDLTPIITGGTEGLTYILRFRNQSTGDTYNLFWSGTTYYRTDGIPLVASIDPSTTNDYYIFRLDNYYKINADYSITIVT